MLRSKLTFTNRKIAILTTLIIIVFTLTTILFPLLLIHLIPQSGIGNYFSEHLHYGFFSIFILLYFIYTGIFSYQIKIDSYIINIRSSSTILGILQQPNFVDIAHTMLRDFTFFNRPFSFNKTLMIKIETASEKVVAKRFNLTFLSKEEEEKISKVLEQIISKNS